MGARGAGGAQVRLTLEADARAALAELVDEERARVRTLELGVRAELGGTVLASQLEQLGRCLGAPVRDLRDAIAAVVAPFRRREQQIRAELEQHAEHDDWRPPDIRDPHAHREGANPYAHRTRSDPYAHRARRST